MYNVGIVAALEREVAPLLKTKGQKWRLADRNHDGRSFRFFEHNDTVLVCGGIGEAHARRAAEALLTLYKPSALYSVGFAGALEPGTRVGDLFLPAQVINAADGSRVTLGEGKGTLVSFSSVANPEQKKKLRESYGAQVVDMEAAAVARAAESHGVRFAAVKAVSDQFDFQFPEIDKFVDSDGRFQQGRFALFIIPRPWLWSKVYRLASNSRKATASLCHWLSGTLSHELVACPEPRKGELRAR